MIRARRMSSGAVIGMEPGPVAGTAPRVRSLYTTTKKEKTFLKVIVFVSLPLMSSLLLALLSLLIVMTMTQMATPMAMLSNRVRRTTKKMRTV